MFSVSGSKIKQNPRTVYATLDFYLESKKCASLIATWKYCLLDCNHILGEKLNCTRGVIKEDYCKDGCNNCTHPPSVTLNGKSEVDR